MLLLLLNTFICCCNKNVSLFLSQGLPGPVGAPGPVGPRGEIVSSQNYYDNDLTVKAVLF